MVAAKRPPERSSLTPVPDDNPSEPNAAVTEVVDETEMPLPSDPRTFFLGGLFALAALAALYVASSIILPVVLARSHRPRGCRNRHRNLVVGVEQHARDGGLAGP